MSESQPSALEERVAAYLDMLSGAAPEQLLEILPKVEKAGRGFAGSLKGYFLCWNMTITRSGPGLLSHWDV